MIYISIGLSNPWSNPFDNLWNKSGNLTKNKSWEAELLRGRQLIGFTVGYTVRQDHAGLNLEVGLFGYSISFMIYDNRHWDSITGTWEVYEHNQTNN
jgi:hypothetical protein